MTLRHGMLALVSASLVACTPNPPPAPPKTADPASSEPIRTASLDAGAPIDGSAADGIDAAASSPPPASSPREESPGTGTSSGELFRRRYAGNGGYCFSIKAFGVHEYAGVLEFRPPAKLDFWLASVNAKVLESQHLSGDFGGLRSLAGTSDVSPHALAASVAFLDSAAAARLNLHPPTREHPSPTRDLLAYEADAKFPADGSPVRLRYEQDAATFRIVHFSYVFGGNFLFNSYVVAFLEEAPLPRGEACPFTKPNIAGTQRTNAHAH